MLASLLFRFFDSSFLRLKVTWDSKMAAKSVKKRVKNQVRYGVNFLMYRNVNKSSDLQQKSATIFIQCNLQGVILYIRCVVIRSSQGHQPSRRYSSLYRQWRRQRALDRFSPPNSAPLVASSGPPRRNQTWLEQSLQGLQKHIREFL